MKSWNLASITTALVLSVSANASISSSDWNTTGDNLITHDTSTQLDWLDLSVTRALSHNQVNGQLGVGGAYEGCCCYV